MKQEFTRVEGTEKVKWSYEKEVEDFEDKEFGKVGSSQTTGYIIFDDKEKALAVLDRDLTEVEKNVTHFEKELEKNKHSLNTFTDLKDLVEAVGKLHNDFKDINTDKIYGLYNNDPKKYQKLFSEFNKSKDYIKDEMDKINKEYGKYLNYQESEKALAFNKEQFDKIKEQRDRLLEL